MSPAVRKAPSPIPIRRERNTLEKLWSRVYLIWILDALLLITAIIGVRVHRGAMQGIGKDSAPSIIAAQHIKAALADMDADAANELLGAQNREAFDKRRADAAEGLIAAAKNITYGEAEEAPIKAIQLGLGSYEEQIQRARDLRDRPEKGKPNEFVEAYREAANTLDQSLLPEADQLAKANAEQLHSIYEAASRRSVGTVFLFLAMGLALLLELVSVQKFLTERTHRILNPLLVASSLIALSFVLYTFTALGTERHRLKVAKEDAFDSISALTRAQAVAYDAHADLSRSLLDPAHSVKYEAAFNANVEQLKKYINAEVNNITFQYEYEAASKLNPALQQYLNVNKDIRGLEQSGNHAESAGTELNQSKWAFDQLDKALAETIDINQGHFDSAVAQGFGELDHFELEASIVAVTIALLAFFGLLQRIREYQ